jgi:hypothetical protein
VDPVKPVITMGSADILAQIMARHQYDEFFEAAINNFMMLAKLRYDGLSRVFELAEDLSTLWPEVRKLEDLIREMEERDEETRLQRLNLALMQETYRELQTELRRAQRVVEEQIYPEKPRLV